MAINMTTLASTVAATTGEVITCKGTQSLRHFPNLLVIEVRMVTDFFLGVRWFVFFWGKMVWFFFGVRWFVFFGGCIQYY
jgi:hypothetical protein